MRMKQEEKRKGPWTEQEDNHLVNFVSLFGDRRWDFIAKVSGLNRTGKSCRLRWVNYLHPGLKRGKMTPHEERLVLELHAKLGNRWSKIARKLPGRTDNEIKNYWRTHMRKQAQEKKRCPASPSSSFSNCCSSSMTTTTTTNTQDMSCQSRKSTGKVRFYDTGGSKNEETEEEEGYSMDDIWREIDHSAMNMIKPVKDIYSEQSYCLSYPNIAWESTLDSIWNMGADNSKMMMMSSFAIDQFPFCFQHSRSPWSLG
ncbi:unnamed protein product [Cochlearia groenlandica]